MLPAFHCAHSIPVPRALRMTASTSARRRDLHKRSGNRAARSRIRIEQERNRGATRFGRASERQCSGERTAGFRQHGMSAFDQ